MVLDGFSDISIVIDIHYLVYANLVLLVRRRLYVPKYQIDRISIMRSCNVCLLFPVDEREKGWYLKPLIRFMLWILDELFYNLTTFQPYTTNLLTRGGAGRQKEVNSNDQNNFKCVWVIHD